MIDRRVRTPLVILAVALGLSLVEAAGILTKAALEGYRQSFLQAMRPALGLWLSMAAVTPIPAWMARRFPLVRGTLWARIPLHVVAAVVFVTAHLVLDIVIQTLQSNMPWEPLGPHLLRLLGNYLPIEMLVYAAVAGSFLYLNARREAEARALATERLRAQLSEAKLAALRSRLAPHFLFNTLNAVSTLALRGDLARVERALALLAGLLRQVLDEGADAEAPLSGEIAFLEQYLEIQQLRFGDRLAVRWDVAAEARDALVPRLLLQPIVENAARHGIDDVAGGEVAVAARRDGNVLVLEVANRSLAGAPAARAGAGGRNGGGIGLVDARERLATLYGDAQSLDLAVGDPETVVRITIPYRRAAGAAVAS